MVATGIPSSWALRMRKTSEVFPEGEDRNHDQKAKEIPVPEPEPEGRRFEHRRSSYVLHEEDYAEEGKNAGYHGEPEGGPEAAVETGQYQECDEGPDGRPCRVHGAMKTEGPAQDGLARGIGDDGIARRGPHPLAHPVGEPVGQNAGPGRRRGEYGPAEDRDAVTPEDEGFSFAEPVGEPSGEDLEDARCALSHAFDESDRCLRSVENVAQE